jgi:hypothetical protein
MARSRYETPQEWQLREALEAMVREFGGPNPENLDPDISSHKVVLDAIRALKETE